MKATIQRFELNSAYDVSIHCPFCGDKVVDMEAIQEGREDQCVKPCGHTIFVANDEGFDYRSPMFNKNMGIDGIDSDDLELPEEGIDGLTDQVSIVDSLKVAAYVGAPSGFGSYIGFAPSLEG